MLIYPFLIILIALIGITIRNKKIINGYFFYFFYFILITVSSLRDWKSVV